MAVNQLNNGQMLPLGERPHLKNNEKKALKVGEGINIILFLM